MTSPIKPETIVGGPRGSASRSLPGLADSPYAWFRLIVALALSTIGGVGMWSVVVALPSVQAEFGVARADASLPYTLTMIGFGFGSILMGRLSDRFGVTVPVVVGTLALALGYGAAASATSLWQLTLAHGLLIGVGSAATFAPLLAHMSLWFARRRGIAIGIFASGNYLAGTIWPPVVQHFIASDGWRDTYFGHRDLRRGDDAAASLLLRRPPPSGEMPTVPARPCAATRRSDCRHRRCRRC